jgi:hypothetical protein
VRPQSPRDQPTAVELRARLGCHGYGTLTMLVN